MRLFFLLIALLLSSLTTPAQTLPATSADTLARQPVAAPLDSATALRRMFAAKRSNRKLVVLGTVLAGGLTACASALSKGVGNSFWPRSHAAANYTYHSG